MTSQTLNRNYDTQSRRYAESYASRYNTGYSSIYGSYARRYY